MCLALLVVGPVTRAVARCLRRLHGAAGAELRVEYAPDVQAALARLAERGTDVVLLDVGRGTALADLLRLQALAPEAAVVPVSDRDPAFDPDPVDDAALGRFLAAIRRARHDRRRLAHRATHDALTGLANRWLFEEKFRDALARALRSGRAGGLVLVDLDGFKAVNDRYGHDTGDLLLETVAARLRGGLRRTDTVARWGGDEFAVLVEQVGSHEHLALVREKLRALVQKPVSAGERTLQVGASLGAVLFPAEGRDLAALVRLADSRLYEDKRIRQGRGLTSA